MAFFGGLYRTAVALKNTAKEILNIGLNDAKTFLGKFKPSNLPLINDVAWGIREAIASKLKAARDFFTEKPLKKIQETRDNIQNVLQEQRDEWTLESGAKRDKSLSRLIQDFDDSIGASDIEVEEGRWFAEQRQIYREWAQKTAIPMTDRYPVISGSDADVIESEERDHSKYASLLAAEKEAEKKSKPTPPNQPDRFIASALVNLINARRERAGFFPLRLGKKLSHVASVRAQEQMKSGTAHLIPLRYIEVPPLERLQIEKTIPVARYRSGKPQFNITSEERKRIVPDSIKKIDDDHYEMKFFEPDEEFAQRARDQQEARNECEYDDFSLFMNFKDGNYPDGDPYVIMDRILANPEHRLALLGEKNTIGIGVTRKEGKIVMNILLENDDAVDPEDDEKIEVSETDTMNNEWWFLRIPEPIRNPADATKINFQKLYDQGFDSGYTLYNLYLFYEKIESLGKTHLISIPKIEFHPQEKILSTPYNLLHIYISINDSTQVVKLINGTDLVDIPREDDKRETQSVGTAITLDEYYSRIQDKPKQKPVEQKFGEVKKKRRRTP